MELENASQNSKNLNKFLIGSTSYCYRRPLQISGRINEVAVESRHEIEHSSCG